MVANIKQIFHCFQGNIPECLSRGSRESLSYIFPNAEGGDGGKYNISGIPGNRRNKHSGIFPEKQENNCYVTVYS